MVNWKKKLGLEKLKKDSLKAKSKDKLVTALRLALSLGVTMSPWGMSQADAAIVRDNSDAVNPVNGVHTIFAAAKNGDIATNRFSEFNLPAQQIANMYFRTGANETDASKLINFVNNRIDIAGTVNAIKGSKIGGDLYFLSPKGMVVSKTGVINAGSLTVMTPTQSWYEKNAKLAISSDAQTAITNNVVPINASGTITVMGNINTNDGVHMKAAVINVGVQEESGQKSYNKANIKSGIVDFKDLVNIKGINGNLEANSGLDVNNLKLDKTANGDIVLAAEQNYMEISKGASSGYKTEEVKAEVNVAGGSQIVAAKAADITATVFNNASTLSYKKADGTTAYFINGESITEEQYKEQYSQQGAKAGKETNPRLAWGSKVNLTAKVNISDEGIAAGDEAYTTVQGERVNVEARSFNNYNSNNNSFWSAEGVISNIAKLVFNGVDVNYGILGSTAEVNIGAGSILKATSATEEFNVTTITPENKAETAKYKTLNVRAYGSDSVSLGAAAGASRVQGFIADAFFNKEANGLSAVPGGGVVYGAATTTATVNVNGNLSSAGTTNVEALSNSELAAKNAVSGAGILEFGVTVVDGTNTATVNINEAAKLTSAKALTVQANALNDFKVTTSVAGKDATATALAIGVADYTSTATTNIKGELTSNASDVNVLANSSFTNNIFTTTNTDGPSKMAGIISGTIKDSPTFNSMVKKIGSGLDTIFFGKISGFKNLKDTYLLTNGSNAVSTLGKALAAGITFGYIEENNKANINIANTATIEAGKTGAGNVNVLAKSNAGDISIGATGTSNNYQKPNPAGETPAAVLFNGAVLAAQVDNEANVNIAGSTGSDTTEKKAQLKANDGNINISSETKVDYQRIQKLYNGLKTTVNNIKTSFDNLKTSGKPAGVDDATWNAFQNYINGLQSEVNAQFSQMFDEEENLKPEYASNENGYAKAIEELNNFNKNTSLNEFLNVNELLKDGKSGVFNFKYNNVEYHITIDTPEKKEWWSDLTTFGIDLSNAAVNSFGIIGNLMDYIDTNKYGNFFINSSTSGQASTPDHHEGAKAAASFTFAYTDLVNKANINVGRNASVVVTGSDASIKLDAKVDSSAVNLDGKIMPSSGGDKGIGSVVLGAHFVDNNALTVVAAGAELKAVNKLEAKSEVDTMQVAVNTGFPMSSVSIEGNVNYLQTHSNNVLMLDEQAKLEAETITLDGVNESKVVNVTGGLSMGGAGGVGAAIGVNDVNRNNLVLIADTEELATMASDVKYNKDASGKDKQDDEETRAKKLIAKKGNLDKTARAGYFASNTTAAGSVKTDSFKAHAKTSGYITNLTADVGISMNSDSDAPGLGAKFGTFMTNTTNRVTNLIGSIDNAIAKKFFDDPVGWQPKPTDKTATNPKANADFPKFTLAGAGSVAVNDIDALTGSVLNGVTIDSFTSGSPVSSVENKAEDTSGAYAVDGGATFTWNKATQEKNQGTKTYAALGAAGINILNTYVTSAIKNSTLNNVNKLVNKASRDGAVVSVGAAVALSFNTDTQIKSGAVSASVTVGEADTKALLKNNKFNTEHQQTAASVTNVALNKDLQVTGGMNVIPSFGGQKAASLGLTGAWTSLTNKVYADVVNGDYYVNGAFKNYAQTNLTQISAGLGLGFSSSDQSKNFQGVAAMTSITNDVQANLKVDGNNKQNIKAAYVENLANDEKMDRTNSHLTSLAERGVDTTGNKYIADAKVGASYDLEQLQNQETKVETEIAAKEGAITAKNSAVEAKKAAVARETDPEKKSKLEQELAALERELAALNQDKKTLDDDKKEIKKKIEACNYLTSESGLNSRGNTIVAAALEIAAGGSSDDSKAGGAAIAYTNIDNDFKATIQGSNVTTTNTSGHTTADAPVLNIAKSNTLAVGVAAGGNGTAGAVAGSGSGVLGVLQNDTISTIADSVLITNGVDVKALNTNKVVDVAGAVSVGKKAYGLDLVYNYMNTNTGAYFKNTSLTAPENDTKLQVLADNSARVYGIALGVGISTNEKAANGSIAANVGHNNVEAVASNNNSAKSLNNLSSLLISSKDDSYLAAAAGGMSVGKGVAAGGSFAYNQLGDLWIVNEDNAIVSDSKNQTNRAELAGYTITTTDNADLQVKANDTSTLTTVSFGAAISSGNFAFEGANATDIVKKSTTANVANTNINSESNNKGNLTVLADSTTDVTVVSGVITGNFGGKAFGVAASENYMYDDTLAQLEGGNYYLKDALVKANSKQELLSVGAGAQVGTGFTLGGSVLVNMLNNNTNAVIGAEAASTKLVTAGNTGVLSYSEENLRNFGGELSLSFGGAAGAGLSVAYNEILGSTNAFVQNADVTAEGNNSTTVAVHDSSEEARKKEKKETYNEETYKGLVVAADGHHELQNLMVTVAGAAGGADTFAAGAGTIVANKLSGATKAEIVGSNINTGASQDVGNNQNVNVLATDYTKSLSIGGAAGVLLSSAPAGAGIGIASDNLVRSRLVESGIDGALTSGKATVNAKNLNVKADAKADLKVNAFGIAVMGGGPLAVAGAGNISVANLTNSTNAYVKNITSTSDGFDVEAKQDNYLLLTTNALSVAVGEATSVAVGLDFVVVDDTSSTSATIENSTLNHYETNKAEDVLKAEHKTTMIQEAAGISAGIAPAGAAASVIMGGNNIDEHVSANLIDSTIGTELVRAKNYTQLAKDEMHADYINVGVAGGAVGVAFGIDVNLIDNAVTNNINNSYVYATEKIDVEAIEDRHVNLNSVAAAGGLFAGVGASFMITSIKDDAEESYDDSVVNNADEHKGKGNGAKADISGTVSQGNSAIASQNKTSADKFDKYIQRGKGGSYTSAKSLSLKTRSVEGEGVNVNVKNSTLVAKNLDIKTDAKTYATQRIITVAGSGVGAGGLAVNVLNNKEDNKIVIDNSTLTATNDVKLSTLTGGDVKGEVYQGAVAGTVAINGAFGFVNTDGNNSIVVQNSSTITGNNNIDIKAKDNTTTEMQAVGIAVSTVGGGIMVSRTTNDTDVEVKLNNSTLKNCDNVDSTAAKTSTINVAAIKNNVLNNMSVAGAGGVVGLNGVFASGKDTGDSSINVAGSVLNGGKVDLKSTLTPRVHVNTGSVAAGVGALGVATSYATAEGQSKIDMDAGSKLIGSREIDIAALVNTNGTKANVEAEMISVSGAVGSLAINYGEAELNTKALLTGKAGLSADKVKLKADQQVLVKTNITGVEATGISLGITSGEGLADLDTTIDVVANANSSIKDLELAASTELATKEEVNGVGFAVAGLTMASATDDTYTADTTINMAGDWKLSGKADISAVNKNKLDTHVDATKATLVGVSGSNLTSSDTMNATVKLQNAKLISAKEQNIAAANILDKKLNLDASGYGAATAQAGSLNDTANYNAKVLLDGAQLITEGHEGEIKVFAYTDGKINDNNKINSAGVATGSLTSSKETITYDNSIVLDKNSSVTAKTADKDITLAAYDITDVNLKATADVQGAAIGTATADNTIDFNRNNKVTVNSGNSVYGNNDVNIYAGTKEEGVSSRLDYNALADVYNHSVLALWTDPDLDNNMTLNNQVKIGGEITSVRHTRITADEGIATIAASEREYKLIGGTSGKGSVTSTVLGETSPDEKIDNFIDFTGGKVTAGIHNDLELQITGNAKLNGESLDHSGINVTVVKGADWFDKNTISYGAVTIANSLLERYNSIRTTMEKYSPGTAEYNLQKNELQKILDEMVISGFAQKDENGHYNVTEKLYEAALKLPDIDVSGGNIYLKTNKLNSNSTSSLTAKGTQALTINNQSNLYLYVQDVGIKAPGGEITYNSNNLKNTDFKGTITKSANGQSPVISINSTGVRTDKDGNNYDTTSTNPPAFTPSIGVFGAISNASGNINITTTSAGVNIYVDKNAQVAGQNISLTSALGNVVQTSSGLLLVGGDPVSQYQFNEDIAKKIQMVYNSILINAAPDGLTMDSFKLNSYEAYCQLLLDKATTFKFTDNEKILIADAKNKAASAAQQGIIAGQNVYLSGVNVNIGGLVQSGYQNYTAVLDNAAKTKVEALDAQYAGRVLSDAEVLGNDTYLVNKMGSGDYESMLYNSSLNAYDYNIKIYYNPTTKKLLTENISVGGGQVYITGAISSTGNGRIVSANGAADISINTSAVARDLTVNSINNTVREGYIKLTDTKLGTDGTIMEYKNGKYRSYARNVDPDSVDWSSSVPDTYTPTDMVYSWTGGATGGTMVEKKHYKNDFVFWGLITWGTTDDFLEKISGDAGNIRTESSSIGTSDNPAQLAAGVSINSSSMPNTNFSVTGSYNATGDVKKSEVVVDKDYGEWYNKIIGKGVATYTWTETTSTNTQTTSTLKANSPISIGFLNGGNDSISVQGAQNVQLVGGISNALATGSVNITAGKNTARGAIDGSNGHINTNKLQAKAKTGADLNVTAIKTTDAMSTTQAHVYSVAGDVNYNQKQGHVEFIASGSYIINGSRNGNLKVTAQGNIVTQGDINSATTAYLKGNRIDLVSDTGSITAAVQHAEQLVSSDTMSASINAKAVGNITMAGRGDGNMRIGYIESSEGYVSLTTSGSFEDAVGDNTLSDADAKLKHWQELGLISDADAANERTNAAAAAKNERVRALEASGLAMEKSLHSNDRTKDDSGKDVAISEQEINARAEADFNALKTEAGNLHTNADYIAAKEQYIQEMNASKNEADRKAAESRMQAKLAEYFSGTSYTKEEQNFIYNYEQTYYSDNYGWSKNDLLYAISNSVINSTPGEIVTVATPNIKANSISLNNANGQGGVGVDAPAVTIKYSDLHTEANLKLLATAKGGDLTWDDVNSQVIVRKQNPLTVQIAHTEDESTHGTITINSKNNVYLAGVKDTMLELHGSLNTSGDVKLMSDNGVMVDGNNGADITAKNLIIYGGKGSVGSMEQTIMTNLSGVLDANAEGDIYLKQVSDNTLVVQNVATKGVIDLSAAKDMVMSTEEGKNMGYLKGSLVKLVSDGGNIGTAANGMRIDNGADTIIASADSHGNVYLTGVNGGTTNIKLVDGNNVAISSDGNVLLTGEEALAGSHFIGAVHAVNSLSISANGSIKQEEMGGIVADSLQLEAVSGIELTNDSNMLHNIAFYNSGKGNVNITNSAKATEDTVITGAGKLLGETEEGLLDGSVTITAKANNLIFDDGLNTGGNVVVTAEAGNVTNNKNIEAGNNVIIEAKAGNLTNSGNILSSNKGSSNNVTLQSKGVLTNSGEIDVADGRINLLAGYEDATENQSSAIINNSGTLSADGHITLKAYGLDLSGGKTAIHNSGNINVPSTVLLQSVNGSVTNLGAINGYVMTDQGDTYGPENVIINAARNIHNGLSSEHAQTSVRARSVRMTATDGSVNNYMNVEATTGNASITAGTSIINNGTLIADSAAAIIEAGDFVENYGNMSAYDQVAINAGKNITNSGTMTAVNGSVAITSDHGDVYNIDGADLYASKGDVTIETKAQLGEAKANIFNYGDLAANGDIILKSNNGDIYNSDDLLRYGEDSIATNNLIIEAVNGTITNTQNLIASKNVIITAKDGLGNFSYDISAGEDIKLTAISGDVHNISVLESNAGNITIEAKEGSIVNGENSDPKTGDIFAWNGNVKLIASGTPGESKTLALDGKEYKKGSVVNYGDIVAMSEGAGATTGNKGTITLESKQADVFNFNDFNTLSGNESKYNNYYVSTGNLNILAKEGEVYSSKNIISDARVNIEAKTGLTNFAYEIYATDDISLKATKGNLINNTKLVSKTGNINLTAEDGTVVNLLNGDMFALGGSVNLYAGAKDSTERVIRFVDNTTGEVRTDTLTLGDAIPEGATVIAIYNATDNKTVVNYVDANNEQHAVYEIAGNVDVFRTGDVINRGDAVALGQTDADGNVTVKGIVTLESRYGNVANYDDLATVDGQAKYTLNKSVTDYNGNWFTDKEYILGKEQGTIGLVSKSGIALKAEKGYFYNAMDFFTEGDLELVAEKDLAIGNGLNIGLVGGDVKVTSSAGTIVNATDLVAGGSVTLDGDKGVTNNRTITSTTGSVELGTKSGNIINNSSVVADENIVMKSEAGAITSEGELTATKGVATIDANADVVITGNITAHSGANIYTDNNGIKLNADVLVEEGLLRVWAGGPNDENEAINIGGSLNSAKGSIDIGATSGDVIVNKNATAGEMMAVGTNNGSIDASKAELIGKLVIAHTDSTDKKDGFSVGTIKASDYISLTTNKADVAKIVNTGTGKLLIDITGPGGHTMAGNLELTTEGNTLLRSLNVHDATVKVEGGTLSIDKLHVTGTATFDALGYTTKVYGVVPSQDDSKAVYYDLGNGKGSAGMALDYDELLIGRDESERQKYIDKIVNDLLPSYKAHAGKYNDGNDGWMNLYIESANHQKSNGLLLHVANKHYVHYQRYSLEDLSSILADYKPSKTYNAYYNDNIGMYERYNLYELPDVEFVNGQLKNTLVSFVLSKDKDEKQE